MLSVYRYPYLTSSTAGFALQETVKRADMRALGSRISAGLAAGSWDIPTLILTGEADKFLKVRDRCHHAGHDPRSLLRTRQMATCFLSVNV